MSIHHSIIRWENLRRGSNKKSHFFQNSKLKFEFSILPGTSTFLKNTTKKKLRIKFIPFSNPLLVSTLSQHPIKKIPKSWSNKNGIFTTSSASKIHSKFSFSIVFFGLPERSCCHSQASWELYCQGVLCPHPNSQWEEASTHSTHHTQLQVVKPCCYCW